MDSFCADQQNKFHYTHQLYGNGKKSSREIDIPPRKLFSRRSATAHTAEIFMADSPKVEHALFQKFLPYNNVDDDDSDPYSSDRFRMYEFKVRKCNRSRSHDWTDCPFAHPGEKARRRDPRKYHYSGTVCEEFRKGHCNKGDNCEFSHGVFERWLHPMRYRTEACKDGKNCKRKVCFFAHSIKQLRILSDNSSPPLNSPCCAHCHTMIASPTSTLMGMSHLSSPPVSPPISLVETEFSPVFRLSLESSTLSYKDALTELMGNLEAMNLNEAAANNGNLFNLDHEQSQFLLSPSTPNPAGSSTFFSGDFTEGNMYNINEIGLAGPDFGWVNDLLT
ncbi:Zinc finger CCCH domain-containing protein 2 [Forsythia ovata]|uniref:Zinc finger CCCH domain-containing protein 2 n=1 Tax=Forsythia ovata TaxID=205694 RepID=A0ABD1WM35_9LAMI